MKKIIFAILIISAFGLQSFAQADQSSYPSEKVAMVAAKIAGDVLPSSVTIAVNTRFDKDNPLTWSKFPYTLKEFGWVYEVGDSDQKLSFYEVNMKTSSKGFLTARYNENGDLIETRERSKNIPVPQYILKALYEGEYKDWRIVGNKEVVNFYQNRGDHSVAEQNFRLNLEKDNVKRKIAFNYEASTGKLEARLIR